MIYLNHVDLLFLYLRFFALCSRLDMRESLLFQRLALSPPTPPFAAWPTSF